MRYVNPAALFPLPSRAGKIEPKSNPNPSMKLVKILALAITASFLGACAHKNPAPSAPTGGGYVQPSK